MTTTKTSITAVILNQQQPLSLQEIIRVLDISEDFVRLLVENDIIQPDGDSPPEWTFDARHLRRVRIAVDLHRELEVNLAGIDLALDLLQKIDALEEELSLHRLLTK